MEEGGFGGLNLDLEGSRGLLWKIPGVLVSWI
jgi:hypothetical protein